MILLDCARVGTRVIIMYVLYSHHVLTFQVASRVPFHNTIDEEQVISLLQRSNAVQNCADSKSGMQKLA